MDGFQPFLPPLERCHCCWAAELVVSWCQAAEALSYDDGRHTSYRKGVWGGVRPHGLGMVKIKFPYPYLTHT